MNITDFDKVVENCIQNFLRTNIQTYWQDAYCNSECIQEIEIKSTDGYVDYLVAKCKELLHLVPFHLCENSDSFCHGSLSSYEKKFQEYVLSGMEAEIYGKNNNSNLPVLYEKYSTKTFIVKHNDLKLSLVIDFPFNYEVKEGVRRIFDRFITVEIRVYGEKCLNIYYFPRNQINRVIYMVHQFIVYDFEPLVKDIEELKIKYDTERKLCSMNKQALVQFLKMYASQKELKYKFDEGENYGYLKIQLPKNLCLTFKIEYQSFLEHKNDIKNLIDDSKTFVESTVFVPYIGAKD